MAQHGKPQLHPQVHQAMEWREVHAGHDQKGVCKGHPPGQGQRQAPSHTPTLFPLQEAEFFLWSPSQAPSRPLHLPLFLFRHLRAGELGFMDTCYYYLHFI